MNISGVDVSNHSLITISIHYFRNTTTSRGVVLARRGQPSGFHPILARATGAEMKREEKTDTHARRRVRGFLTLARSLPGLSISGLGGNFSSLWRIITESFPHRVASAINDPAHAHARAFKGPTHGFCSTERQEVMRREKFE